MLNENRVAVWKVEINLEMENGDDSTTLSVYLVSLNYTLKMVKLAKKKKDKEKVLRV